jgi:hypothetical protein
VKHRKSKQKPALILTLFLLLSFLLLPVACQKEENPLLGLWALESGDMDVSQGKGTTLLEFRSNGEIEISAEIPRASEDDADSEYEIIRYRTLNIKYEFISENRLSLSTTQLGETIREEASFLLDGSRLTIAGDKSGTLQLIRR